jgi:ribosome biogenesis protein Nip4
MDVFTSFTKQFVEHFDTSSIKSIGRSYYLAEPELRDIKDSVKRDIFAMGVFLGEAKDKFYPTPAFLEMVAKNPASDNRKIYVNKKAEWLFLCGRNILMESIAKNPHNISEGLVLVQNERDENLGYGIFKQEGKDLVVRNLLDRGMYLRVNEKRRKN